MNDASKHLIGLCLVLLMSANSRNVLSMATDCDTLWEELSRTAGSENWSVARMIQQWKSRAAECLSKPQFNSRLGYLYLLNNQQEEATGVARQMPGTKEGEDLLLTIEHHKQAKRGKVDAAFFAQKYDALVRKYPNWAGGHLSSAYFHTQAKDYSRARVAARRAMELDQGAAAYRLDAISSFELADYEAAITSGHRAIKTDPALEGDKELMFRVSDACIKLGMLPAADGVLSRLENQNPAVAREEGFTRRRREIEKLAAAKR